MSDPFDLSGFEDAGGAPPAPAGAPEIAGVVFGEHAEHGSLAAPIAKHVMETYFAKQEGRPRPVLPLPARPHLLPPVVVATNP